MLKKQKRKKKHVPAYSAFVSGRYIQYISIRLLNYAHVLSWKRNREMCQSRDGVVRQSPDPIYLRTVAAGEYGVFASSHRWDQYAARSGWGDTPPPPHPDDCCKVGHVKVPRGGDAS